MNSIDYLINREWSMGNGGSKNRGQCPDCCAKSLMWIEDFGGWGTHFGHKRDCPLAIALEAEEVPVTWEQKYMGNKSSSIFKTKEEEKLWSDKIDNYMYDLLTREDFDK